jgi:NitT/TauT family transport system substrate-binding protein
MLRKFNLIGALVVSLCMLSTGRAVAFTIIVTEAGTPLVPNSLLELADHLGYFQREGVSVTLKRVAGTPTAVAVLSAGEGDMANVSLSALLKLTARGDTQFRAIFSPCKSFSYVIAARQEIGSVVDLRGRMFGVGQVGSLDYTLSRYVLRQHGLDSEAVQIVSVGSPQMRLKALAAGKIHATTTSIGTWTALADKPGLHLVVSKDE